MAVRAKKQKEESFEESMEYLEDILEKLESEKLSLSALVEQYSKAKEYIKICKKHLEQAELKISLIEDNDTSKSFNLEQ